MLALIKDGTVSTFPYTDKMLRRDNPQTSFPGKMTDELRASFGVAPVTQLGHTATTSTQIAVAWATPQLLDGRWFLGWDIREKTPEEAAAELEARKQLAKAECHRRIVLVADEASQLNLAAAAGGGILTEEQGAIFLSSLAWIKSMRDTWRALAASGADLDDDSNWPAPPAGVDLLVSAF